MFISNWKIFIALLHQIESYHSEPIIYEYFVSVLPTVEIVKTTSSYALKILYILSFLEYILVYLNLCFFIQYHFVIWKRCPDDKSPQDFTMLWISVVTIKYGGIESKYLTIRVIAMCNVICDGDHYSWR